MQQQECIELGRIFLASIVKFRPETAEVFAVTRGLIPLIPRLQCLAIARALLISLLWSAYCGVSFPAPSHVNPVACFLCLSTSASSAARSGMLCARSSCTDCLPCFLSSSCATFTTRERGSERRLRPLCLCRPRWTWVVALGGFFCRYTACIGLCTVPLYTVPVFFCA